MSGDDTDIFSESITVQDGPHHSTPIKDGPFKRPPRLGRVTARVEPSSPGRNAQGEGQQVKRSSIDRRQQRHTSQHSAMVPMMETSTDSSTVEKQRREIQLLIQELRDRDSELNETVSAHSQQLLAWERDRQRLLTLEQKNARYESELQRKRKQLEAAMLKLKSARDETQNNSTSLSLTQEQLQHLSLQKQTTEVHIDNLAKQNVSLNDSLKAMSGTVGQLEAREQELITLLRIKEREIEQATSTVLDLNTRVQQLDLRCQECQNREAEALHRATQWKQKYTQARSEIESFNETLKSKDSELDSKDHELHNIHQQMGLLQQEMLISVERERRKDEMIESLRAKQERILAELRSVRELYERQQREITLMQLNFDCSKENSNQNSHLDYSVSLDESINYQTSQPIQPVSPQHRERYTDSSHVSFEERLSTFLDVDTDAEAVSHLDSSPASKLQRLLTESRHMIESLEKSTLPASTSQEKECLEGQNQLSDLMVDGQTASHSSSQLQNSSAFTETHDQSDSRQTLLADSQGQNGISRSYQREHMGAASSRANFVDSNCPHSGYPSQLTSSHQTLSPQISSRNSTNGEQYVIDSEHRDSFVQPSKHEQKASEKMTNNSLSQYNQTTSQSHASNISRRLYENDADTSDNFPSQSRPPENHSIFVQQSHHQHENVQEDSKNHDNQYPQSRKENSSDFSLQSQHHQLDSEDSNNKRYPQTLQEFSSMSYVRESCGPQDNRHPQTHKENSDNFLQSQQHQLDSEDSNNKRYPQTLQEFSSMDYVRESNGPQDNRHPQTRKENSDNFLQSQQHQLDSEDSNNKRYPQTLQEFSSMSYVKQSYGPQDNRHGTLNNHVRQLPQSNSPNRSNNPPEAPHQETVMEGSELRTEHCHSPLLAGHGFGDSETSEILRRQVNS